MRGKHGAAGALRREAADVQADREHARAEKRLAQAERRLSDAIERLVTSLSCAFGGHSPTTDGPLRPGGAVFVVCANCRTVLRTVRPRELAR